MTVLLVDDDALVLAAVACFLRRRGIHTICAASPFGVSVLVRRECPDIVVLDCQMPGLDGAAVLGLLRANPRTAATPVVLYSAGEDLAERARALGVRYVSKFRGPSGLVDTILAATGGARVLETPEQAHLLAERLPSARERVSGSAPLG